VLYYELVTDGDNTIVGARVRLPQSLGWAFRADGGLPSSRSGEPALSTPRPISGHPYTTSIMNPSSHSRRETFPDGSISLPGSDWTS
jgi:hypothetical protein